MSAVVVVVVSYIRAVRQEHSKNGFERLYSAIKKKANEFQNFSDVTPPEEREQVFLELELRRDN